MCLLLACDSWGFFYYPYNEIIVIEKRLYAQSISVGATHQSDLVKSKEGFGLSETAGDQMAGITFNADFLRKLVVFALMLHSSSLRNLVHERKH